MSILDRVHAHGGEVVRQGWRVTVRRGRLSDDALAWVKEHRAEIMREIWPAYDDWEERAAIREYDGGQPREDAEKAAYEDVTCST